MTVTGPLRSRIEEFARQLAEEFGEIAEESLDENALSWLACRAAQGASCRWRAEQLDDPPQTFFALHTGGRFRPCHLLRLCGADGGPNLPGGMA